MSEVRKNMKYLPSRQPVQRLVMFGALLLAGSSYAAVGDQYARVTTESSEKTQNGRVAFVDASRSKLVEMDLSGKITWEYAIPRAVIGQGLLNGGTDVEWLPASDNFLLAIPGAGVFEISRRFEVVWKYETRFADHDADRLANGNTVFVNGWDADGDPVLTEVDPAGKVVVQLFAAQLGLDRNERNNVQGERYSNTHANAVQALAGNDYLVSLRNYNQFLKISGGVVVERYKNARNVHDPFPYQDGFLFAAHTAEDKSVLVRQSANAQRRPFFRPELGSWTPLRTVELLTNGNILISGGKEIGQLDAGGNLVWAITIENFESGKSAQKSGRFVYKAAFVYK